MNITPKTVRDMQMFARQRANAVTTDQRYAKARKNGIKILTRADLAAQCQRNQRGNGK